MTPEEFRESFNKRAKEVGVSHSLFFATDV